MAKRRKPVQIDAGGATTPLEWLVAAAGALIVASIVGFMVFTAVTGNGEPPDIVVEHRPPVAVSAGHLVRFSAVNRGGSTAAQLTVEGVLRDPSGQEVERSQATFDYLPKHSRREGGLFFEADPAGHSLHLRATGYEAP